LYIINHDNFDRLFFIKKVSNCLVNIYNYFMYFNNNMTDFFLFKSNKNQKNICIISCVGFNAMFHIGNYLIL
jgi:hypothetical protein